MRLNVAKWKHPDNPFTVTGRVLFLGVIVGLLFLIKSDLAPLWVYLTSFMVLTFVVGLLFRTHLSIRSHSVPLTSQGEKFVLPIHIENRRRVDAFDLQLDVIVPGQGYVVLNPKQSISGISQRGSITLELQCQALRRGVFALPRIRIASLFPFGLFRFFQIIEPVGTIEIAPAICRQAVVEDAAIHDDLQEHTASMKSSLLMNDYVGSREYQIGMPVRRWDFASWARLGKPAVREFAGHSDTLLVIVVDTSSPHHRFQHDEAYESALSTAAGLIDQFDDHRLTIELVVVEQWQSKDASDIITPLESKEEGLKRLAHARGSQQPVDWPKFFHWLSNAAPTDAVILAVCRNDADSELRQIVASDTLAHHHVRLVVAGNARRDQVKAT